MQGKPISKQEVYRKKSNPSTSQQAPPKSPLQSSAATVNPTAGAKVKLDGSNDGLPPAILLPGAINSDHPTSPQQDTLPAGKKGVQFTSNPQQQGGGLDAPPPMTPLHVSASQCGDDVDFSHVQVVETPNTPAATRGSFVDDNVNEDIVSSSSIGMNSSNSSTGLSGTGISAYKQMRVGPKCLRKVPFEYQVVVALCVPLIFLLVYQGMTMSKMMNEDNYIRMHRAVVEASYAFEGQAMLERGKVGPFMGHTLNATLAAAGKKIYEAQFAATDAAWDRLQHELGQLARDYRHMSKALNKVATVWAKVSANRQATLTRMISGPKAREVYTEVVESSQGVLRGVMKDSAFAGLSYQEMAETLFTRMYINALGVVRGCGNELTSLDLPPTEALTSELFHGKTIVHSLEKVVIDVADPDSNDGLFVREWNAFQNDPTTLHAMNLTELISDPVTRGNVTSAEWFKAMTDIINRLNRALERINESWGSKAVNIAIEEAIKMIIAVVISGIATAFIVFWQVRIAQNIEQQREAAVKMNELVSAFVPRNFLRTMGARSLSHAAPGTHTEVATTLVFSDIRNFTGMCDGMSNEEMFLWLQQYFEVMTRVTDYHNGVIDKFIGDAIFAFFPVPTNSVRCAIEWQSVAGFLNAQLGTDNMIRIGVGIHHGLATFGIFGDDARRTGTLVSPEVNFAARLEGLTKHYGVRILASQSVIDQINTDHFVQTGDIVHVVHGSAVHKAANSSAVGPTSPVAAGDHLPGLGHRFVGAVHVKGSRRTHDVYEIFQADEWQLKRYKQASKELFEKAVRLRHSGPATHNHRKLSRDDSVRNLPKLQSQSIMSPHFGSPQFGSPFSPVTNSGPLTPTEGSPKHGSPTTNGSEFPTAQPSTEEEFEDGQQKPSQPVQLRAEQTTANTNAIKLALGLYEQCRKMAIEAGVRDTVLEIKMKNIGGVVDEFHEK